MRLGERFGEIRGRLTDPNFSERRSIKDRLEQILGEKTERTFSLNEFPAFDFEGVWSLPKGEVTGISVSYKKENSEKVFRLTLETEEGGIGIEVRSNSISPFVLVKPGTTREIPVMSIKNMSETERVLLEFGNTMVDSVAVGLSTDIRLSSSLAPVSLSS